LWGPFLVVREELHLILPPHSKLDREDINNHDPVNDHGDRPTLLVPVRNFGPTAHGKLR
jgi:hypothetical protein